MCLMSRAYPQLLKLDLTQTNNSANANWLKLIITIYDPS